MEHAGKTSYYRNKDAEEDPDWFHNTVLGVSFVKSTPINAPLSLYQNSENYSSIPSSGETWSTPGITAKRYSLTILAVMPSVDHVSPDEGIN
jgi:hypothetical protein